MGFFKRSRNQSVEVKGLGSSLIARRLDDVRAAPTGSAVVWQKGEQELVYCFHPGPYQVDVTPFAAAPEIGLRLRFVIEANPRVSQQRFDLYLFSEAAEELSLADLGAAAQGALQHELAQGGLELPPCTSLEEWHAFRAGLNQLLYTRFGVTVDDCVPVDLGDSIDYAAVLRVRATAPVSAPAPACPSAGEGAVRSVPAPAAVDRAADARALRRLFLELPALTGGIRLLILPKGRDTFQSHQAILQRLSLLALSVGSMPSLEWHTPDQPLESAQQLRRIAHSQAAAVALDEAWALLAQLQMQSLAPWLERADEADRILANLEYHLSQRRIAYVDQDEQPLERREPKL